MKPPIRWAAGELPEDVAAALASADADAPDQAVDKVRARLDAALGAAFAAPTPPTPPTAPTTPRIEATKSPARTAELVARGNWLGPTAIAALVAIGAGLLWLGHPATDAAAVGRALPPAAAETDAVYASDRAHDASAQEPELPPRAPEPDELQPSAAGAPAQAVLPPMAASAPARASKRAAAPPSPSQGLAEELRQLKQMRQHVASAPARALAEADAHAHRFPQGTLGPERELLRIDALLRLGRVAEARQLAARELAAPSGTPYRARIEKLLSAH